MRLATLIKQCEALEGVVVETKQTKEGDGGIISDYYKTSIVDYRNLNGKVGKTPTIGVTIYHTKPQAGFDEALRSDVALDHATTIRTVKKVASMLGLDS